MRPILPIRLGPNLGRERRAARRVRRAGPWPLGILTLALLPSGAARALDLPEVGVAYEIEVRLDPATRRLEGHETIRWTNRSNTPQDRLPLHLYLNAFSHEDTTWMRSVPAPRFDLDKMLRVHADPWGWIEPRSIRQDEVPLQWRPVAPDDGNPMDRSLAEVALAMPLAPGETVELEIDFEARLPVPFARTGGRDDFFVVAQWFPKLAVLETAGVRGAQADRWNAHQFHGPTEFYAEYADFDVRIGVPTGWRVVATGQGGPEPEGADGAEVVWHRYRQRAVHDFAWSAGSRMVDVVSAHDPQGPGGPVEIHLFLPREVEHQSARWEKVIRASLDVLGSRVGPYPYATLTVVQPPFWATNTLGMEYPTFILGGPGDPALDSRLLRDLRVPELIIAHEFAHEYFYGLIGTNEFEDAYLDEGFTEYWGDEVARTVFGEEAGLGSLLGRPLGVTDGLRTALPHDLLPDPVWAGPSYLARNGWKFSQFYHVPAATMYTAARLLGQETVDRAFAAYLERWAFRHPRLEDFLAVSRESAGEPFADLVEEAFTRRRLPDYRVESMEVKTWKRPRGRLTTPKGVVEPDADADDVDPLAGLDPLAREDEGRVAVQILDPGWTDGGERFPGRIEVRMVEPEPGDPDDDWNGTTGGDDGRDTDEDGADEYHLSTVRVAGEGWRRLPVEVRFRFADGAVLRETWDGHAGYRIYRFLRPAPLSEVRIDPGERIVLDPDIVNNGRTREPDDVLVGDWSAWLGGLFQLVAEGLSLWL